MINKTKCDHHYPRGSDGRLNKCEFCGNEKHILWSESYFDEESYLLGNNSNLADENPFLENTNSWYNWNRGINNKNK